jgi:hypothetical protein
MPITPISVISCLLLGNEQGRLCASNSLATQIDELFTDIYPKVSSVKLHCSESCRARSNEWIENGVTWLRKELYKPLRQFHGECSAMPLVATLCCHMDDVIGIYLVSAKPIRHILSKPTAHFGFVPSFVSLT